MDEPKQIDMSVQAAVELFEDGKLKGDVYLDGVYLHCFPGHIRLGEHDYGFFGENVPRVYRGDIVSVHFIDYDAKIAELQALKDAQDIVIAQLLAID